MNTIVNTRSAEYARAVSELFDGTFAQIVDWKAAIESYLDDRQHDLEGAALRSDVLDELIAGLVLPVLAADPALVVGAGFVSRPGLIADAPWHLAWWLGDTNTFGLSGAAPRTRRLHTIDDPAADGFRDFTSLEWWRRPIQDGGTHITGPYVDYLCTDEYTLTVTTPVFSDQEVAGVVGVDLYVRDLERILLPKLHSTTAAVSVVNEAGRVLVSTDARLATGSLIRLDGLAAAGHSAPGAPRTLAGGYEAVDCGNTGLVLVSGPLAHR